jgi:hypothetical protein
MMMVRVTDNTLRAALLMHLIEQLERGDLGSCIGLIAANDLAMP